MSQCVPQCERDGGLPRYPHIHHCSMIQDGMSDYVVSELTWEKGHLARHGLHTHPVPKHPTFPGATSSEKPLPSGTLEALVDQVTNPGAPNPAGCHLVPWLGAPASPFPAPDALVPSAKLRPRPGQAPRPGHVLPNPSATTGTGGSRAGSCSGRKRTRVGAGDGDRSATGSVASIALAFNGGVDEAGFATSAVSPPGGSPGTENTSCGRPACFSEEEEDEDSDDSDDDSDEEGKSKNEKVTSHVSTKRNRTAAIHNQSERKRRDRINQRMRTLQKLVPNSSKTDKASILDEVIGYMKQLQAQVQMMNSMNRVPHMVMPMAMQQLQVAMMAQMAQMAQVGMATGMMGVRTLGGGVRQPAVPWGAFFPPLLPADIPGRDQLQAPGGALLPDLSTAFMPCQTHQPMAVDAYRSMAALYQQLYQLPPGS